MSNKQAYITLMGRSGWAVVNSFYASIIETEFRPDQVHLIYESEYANHIKPVIRGLEIIQSTYAKKPCVQRVPVPDWDMHSTRDVVSKIANELMTESMGSEYKVALDITGGRKALVIGALLGLQKTPPERIYYLGIETTEDAAKPYLMIPKRIQTLRDLVKNEVQNEKISTDPTSSDTDLLLLKNSMMVLLNQSYARDENIIVKAPFLGVTLLELDLKNQKVIMRTSKSDYEAKRRAHKYRGSDHPKYSDLGICICYCGLLEYENESEFREVLAKEIIQDFSRKRRKRRSYLSLDSNLFYYGFPSRLQEIEKSLAIQSKDVLCVTPYAVGMELTRRIKGKYRKPVIQAAKNHYKGRDPTRLVGELIWESDLDTRKAKMANLQLSKFKSRPVHAMTLALKELPRDSEEVDHIIIESLASFARDHRASVHLFAADKDQYHRDFADDVYIYHLGTPTNMSMHIPKTMDATDKTFVDLLIGLSHLYGVVELKRIGFLFGGYKGKTQKKYMSEMKLRLRNLQRATILRERLDTCRNLKELNIIS